ncbi:hypothetical protein [Bradyrhizobium lablabi]|uniref:hypothetical protein n=1 Tax=Bradyrhizobium lablabi TaxID=722472 RepID=UPI001BAE4294|nr:hypothetical protein [Bradyrhizobium lablabi]MBR0695035.1 hypothetical protein [Bradyrhizobium lablabi]
MLQLRFGCLHGLRNRYPRDVEFRPEVGKFTRQVICLLPFLLKRLRLSDSNLDGLDSMRLGLPCGVELSSDRRQLTREFVGLVPLLIEQKSLFGSFRIGGRSTKLVLAALAALCRPCDKRQRAGNRGDAGERSCSARGA